MKKNLNTFAQLFFENNVSKLKKLFISILFFVIAFFSVMAQHKVVENLQQSDYKLLHFGFTLGLHTQEFAFTPNEIPDAEGITWYGDVTKPTPGFTVGIISDLRLGDYFNLRFVPTLNFGDRQIVFSGFENDIKTHEFKTSVLSTLVSLPFYMKYRSHRVQNYRPYLIVGGGTMIDLSRKKDLPILLKPLDFFVEFGVGCDFYLPYFKLAPELKMCIGFNDMLERNRPLIQNDNDLKYTESISRLTSRLFVLTFNFE